MKKITNVLLVLLSLLFISANIKNTKQVKLNNTSLTGDLIIFHAGSLSVPMKEITTAFKKENPDVNIMMEAAGSVECARKITELKKPCDIMASADYTVIDKMLIPNFADWNIKFASNEMAIVYTDKSKRGKEITKNNWYKIMLDKNVQIGRADPNADPCGYRSVLVSKLAEKYYKQSGMAEQLLKKDENNIRPKETDLLALLETGNVDYIFLYRSVAEQHKLKYLLLPDEINLKNSTFSELYSSVSVEINGKTPTEKITQKGEPMVYGITIPKNAPNQAVAMAFLKFMLTKTKGMAILQKLGQPSVIPSPTKSFDKIPSELKAFASKQK
ncbi:MAG: tungstate ABC transporter substrate-binding protein WtpA [Bacteroidia bacterium]|nr:tungstate ABC transporter substrate-binding protein WtpA [Bacteroidia bacterium]